MERIVEPELLDELPGDDPRARRSRRDLRLINFLMGNERWIRRTLAGKSGVIELGAGNGALTRTLPGAVGLDFQPAPEDLRERWREGDLFETLPTVAGDTVVACLILHHFKDAGLRKLGALLAEKRRLVVVEPWRSRAALVQGKALFPVVNDVTRHDMMVSIRAGFVPGELGSLLGLTEAGGWRWREKICWRGGLRAVAERI